MAQRPPVDILALFGQHRCQQIITDELNKNSTIEDPVRGCWLSQTGHTAEGYARVSKKTNSTLAREGQGLRPPHTDSNTGFVTVFLHRVAYVSRTGQNIPGGMQASHLCDEPNCFYPQHIVAEDGNTNASRKNCVQIRCPHHNFNMVMDLCTHTPKCIKKAPDPATFFCCLSDPPSSSDDMSSLGPESQEQANFYSNLDYSDLPEGASDEAPTEDETEGGSESQISESTEAPTDTS
jgi:hypothetical protein